MVKTKITVEICVESLESAVTAENAGVDRIELCSDLLEGGITPSFGLTKLVTNKLKIPVNVLIRPRGGDFYYSDHDFEVMKKDVKIMKELNANGIVVGILKSDGTVDKERMSELIDLAVPMGVTFHRAFDMTRDSFEALETLIGLGVHRILTSGQTSSAFDGRMLIKKLVDKAGGRIIIMPGGGVNGSNAKKIIDECGVTEIHSSASEKVMSKMIFRNSKMSMGKGGPASEYEWRITSAEKIKSLIGAVS